MRLRLRQSYRYKCYVTMLRTWRSSQTRVRRWAKQKVAKYGRRWDREVLDETDPYETE